MVSKYIPGHALIQEPVRVIFFINAFFKDALI